MLLLFLTSLLRLQIERPPQVGEQRISGGHVFHPVLQLDRTGGPDLLVHRDLQVEGARRACQLGDAPESTLYFIDY